MRKNAAAAALGKLGGKVKSAAKAAAVRENGKKGGRPHKCNPRTSLLVTKYRDGDTVKAKYLCTKCKTLYFQAL